MKTLLLPLCSLLAFALTRALEAQPESAYYGVSIGAFDYSDRAAGLGDKFHGSASAWRATIGYQFLTHFAFEGSYGETSTLSAMAKGAQPSTELEFETEFSKILGFRALGTFPFDNGLSLMAGAEFVYIEQDLALSINGIPFFSANVDRNGQLAFYLGAQYDWDRVAVRLSYQKFDFSSEAAAAFIAADGHEVALSVFYKL
jgi:hypothetical protein